MKKSDKSFLLYGFLEQQAPPLSLSELAARLRAHYEKLGLTPSESGYLLNPFSQKQRLCLRWGNFRVTIGIADGAEVIGKAARFAAKADGELRLAVASANRCITASLDDPGVRHQDKVIELIRFLELMPFVHIYDPQTRTFYPTRPEVPTNQADQPRKQPLPRPSKRAPRERSRK